MIHPAFLNKLIFRFAATPIYNQQIVIAAHAENGKVFINQENGHLLAILPPSTLNQVQQ